MLFLKNKLLILSALILCLYLSPLVVFGEDSYILIHDNLDSNLVWFKVLAESGMAFSGNYETITSFMGTPRVSLGNEFDFLFLLYNILDPYNAYVLNQVLIRVIAFFGMFLFLDKYILKNMQHKEYVVAIALLYSLLPFWPSGGLSVAGLPLITYVFLNIKCNQETLADWVVLILFPFYSVFILSMMFYIIFVGIIWIIDVSRKKLNIKFTLAIFIFSVVYLLLNYRLLEAFIFNTEFISHRVERVSAYYGFYDSLIRSLKYFIFGQYHAHSIHIGFLPFITIIFLLNLVLKPKDKLLIGLFVLNIFISLWYGFWKYEVWESIRENSSILSALNLSRVHFLTPFIWYTLLGLSIKYYMTYFQYRYKTSILYLMILVNIIFLFYKSDFIQEYKHSDITYRQFYSEQLFQKIDKYIGKNKSSYKVLSLGIHPAISQYNGFYTLDGYNANYSLSYKHKFRAIIAQELDKNRKLQKAFDYWGSRCYLFSNDVGYYFIRRKNDVYPIDINIDTDIIKKLGGKYIFSSYLILNEKENNIQLLKLFEDETSAWKIYLYEIMDKNETKTTI